MYCAISVNILQTKTPAAGPGFYKLYQIIFRCKEIIQRILHCWLSCRIPVGFQFFNAYNKIVGDLLITEIVNKENASFCIIINK